ncbi:MAG TPA: PIG-L family deacetylase [Anaerolineales bacterium]|nr:PIG-L family deacetylase [Anaerolineales bacterium]HNN13391.1 PIG-L family deacetylase [Anaerolineales bacterium]
MRWIYLSPHLDDAVLSAGGWIYDQVQAGNPVEIWTTMCGYPPEAEFSMFAQMLHQRWGVSTAEECISLRRREDISAAGMLGASTRHFDFFDCIYRADSKGEWLYPGGVFAEPHPNESDLPSRIAQAVSARLKPDDQLICQFGIGKHVDHVVARRAFELLGRPLTYVADIPYLFNNPDHLAPNTAGMMEKVETVSEAGLSLWPEAILAYKSQISSLFDGPEQVREQISGYCSKNGGLRFWNAPDKFS